MAIQSGLFRSNGGDRKYKASFFASYFASFIGNGVFPNPSSGLQVTPSSNLNTVVRPGKAWINGYYMINDSDYVLSHDIADGVLSRIDRVVIRLDFLTREIGIYIKKGLPSSTPTAPTLQRDNDIYELALADVRINNGATTLNSSNITDQRLNSSLCGIVQGVVNQVDTTTIFNQYQTALNQVEVQGQQSFEQFLMDRQEQFDVFFQGIQDTLDGDIAASLALQIQNLQNDKADLSTVTALDSTLTTLNTNFSQHRDNYLVHGITGTTGGGPVNYVLTLTPPLTSYQRGLRLTLFFNIANTGSATLKVGELSSVALKNNDGSNLRAGDLVPNRPYLFVYNGTDFFLASGGGGDSLIEYEDFFDSLGEISKETTTTVGEALNQTASTSGPNHAIFAGGFGATGAGLSRVTYFNSNLVNSTATLGAAKGSASATSISNYSLVAGGSSNTSSTSGISTVDAFNSSMVRTAATDLSAGRYSLAATTINDKALFGGGVSGVSNYSANVDSYNTSLVRTTLSPLYYARGELTAASNGDYAIFAGGNGGSVTFAVDSYNTELVRTSTTTALSLPRSFLAGGTCGNFALFGGGVNASGVQNVTDAYNNSLTRTTPTTLIAARQLLAATKLNQGLTFAGGRNNETYYNTVEYYSPTLSRISLPNLNNNKYELGGASVGNYALFYGGRNASQSYSTVEPYLQSINTNILITQGSSYALNGATETIATSNIKLTFTTLVNGYVKIKPGKFIGGF